MEWIRKYTFIWMPILIVVVISAAAYYFFHAKKTASPASKKPSVSLKIVGEHTLAANWQDLGSDVQSLNIYEAERGTDRWSLMQNVPLPENSQDDGSVEIKTDDVPLNNKSFYVEAVNGTSGEQQVIWTSPPIIPLSGSTPQNPPGNGTSAPPLTPPDTTPILPPEPSSTTTTSTANNPPNPPAPTSTPSNNSTSTSSSTLPDNSPSPSSTSTSTPGNTPPAPTSTANTPPPATSFQVSNSNAWVDITWQYLPSNTVSLEISRSINPGGPWTVFYAKQNPEIIGPYTARVPEDTPNTAFFYQLTAYGTSTVVGTNGPIFLSASKM